ncbi:hypothetical protein L249_4753 [Ophiocordyceps polyrhachis-furcata BCC 54312]|uniref:Uncharacterized protein n=1 Tax=Ophiocordyceps polyrhachis-furcata BCC 54312 TaxID=1330021 RepID=A0A367L2E3_9HYPO|nr:hypothetical protein L249_4753 [Ophiocordyceps polyrhachis-furcata BCC 54312]
MQCFVAMYERRQIMRTLLLFGLAVDAEEMVFDSDHRTPRNRPFSSRPSTSPLASRGSKYNVAWHQEAFSVGGKVDGLYLHTTFAPCHVISYVNNRRTMCYFRPPNFDIHI